jgi:hypothetical protein
MKNRYGSDRWKLARIARLRYALTHESWQGSHFTREANELAQAAAKRHRARLNELQSQLSTYVPHE